MGKNRFIPAEIPLALRNNPRFRAELLVYDELKAQLDLSHRDWMVIYQAKWLLKEPSQEEPKEGEADFLLSHPKRGVITVEVKGGLISFRDGQWFSRDRHGVEYSIDPFGQVARNARHLAKKLNELPQWKGAPISKLGRLVIFPDSAMPPQGTFPGDVSPDIVVDKLLMGGLVERVLLAARFWFGDHWKHPFADKANSTLEFLFARPLEFTDSLGANLPLETREFDRLTDDQFRLVRAVANVRRLACRGGAGAGKTWFARKRAMQLQAEGFRTLLLCRSSPLAEYLRSITPCNENLFLASYSELASLLFGQTIDSSGSDYGWQLLELAEQHPERRFDAIMVDEAQDFRTEEWDFIEGLLRDPKCGVLYLFLDDNQQVYAHHATLPGGMIEMHLGDNVRTTRSIHTRVQDFYQSEPPQRPLGPLGRQVEFIDAGADEPATIRRVIRTLIDNERVSADDVAVLTPRELAQSRLRDLSLHQGRRLSPKPRPGTDVGLSTVQEFKGLERAVIVLAEADGLPADKRTRTRFCYTAFSRPRSHLIVVGDWS